ncbi:phosphatidylinositol-4-phosphate 5-Kinase [Sesbania bispinosa]|nr:phosphatidylinositol-4-phosphate 5-Kinase [Sesbania bispinosa]
MDNWAELSELLIETNRGVTGDARETKGDLLEGKGTKGGLLKDLSPIRNTASRAQALQSQGAELVAELVIFGIEHSPPSSSPAKPGCRARYLRCRTQPPLPELKPKKLGRRVRKNYSHPHPSSMLGIMILPSSMISNPPSTCLRLIRVIARESSDDQLGNLPMLNRASEFLLGNDLQVTHCDLGIRVGAQASEFYPRHPSSYSGIHPGLNLSIQARLGHPSSTSGIRVLTREYIQAFEFLLEYTSRFKPEHPSQTWASEFYPKHPSSYSGRFKPEHQSEFYLRHPSSYSGIKNSNFSVPH